MAQTNVICKADGCDPATHQKKRDAHDDERRPAGQTGLVRPSVMAAMENASPASYPKVRCLTLLEVSRQLGVCPRTVRSWVKDPTIRMPAIKVGGRLLFPENEILSWRERFRVRVVDVNEIVKAFEQSAGVSPSCRGPNKRS